MYWKKANYVIVASLEPRPKQRYSENLAFVLTEPFLTRLVQSYTQQLVTTVSSVLAMVELTACPPKYRRNLHVNYVPPNLPVALIS